ncbi:MAG TPA: cytochrome c-type biogenesis protein [Methylovirgula sp.]|jgi:cytochrome c-type biogenesis protein CcmH|nr:cytochrome c-type biogenesis protein [Methylovirgula sp.]HVE04351.1 cytochrome c-type biogenesis protein [Rhizomicrobium sp.]
MRQLGAIALVLAIIASSSSLAVQPEEMLKDPKLEARARELSRELRCMVCQNQSIDESEAPLARDLRLLVRERLSKGDTDQQVLDFLVARYGEFVLLKPPLESKTIILWALPPVALLAGAISLFFAVRRRRTVQLEPATLSIEERRRLSTLVDEHRTER